MQVTNELKQAVYAAIEKAQEATELAAFAIPAIVIERPKDSSHGDYSSPTALRLSKLARMAPRDVANIIVKYLVAPEFISEVTLAGPGFINFRLSNAYLHRLLEQIIEDDQFGQTELGVGKRAQIEFVSANPTGPITIGRTRGGVIGDTLARLMEAAGYDVTREYYYNDAGRQIQMLGESVQIRYLQELGDSVELTTDHYQGLYIRDLARALKAEHGHELREEAADYFGDYAKNQISVQQKASLERIGITHDVYFNENSLYADGSLTATLETLEKNGYLYEKDGAKWLKTTAFGDDKDRVAVRSSDGRPTYRVPDIAYHQNKAERQFDVVVDIFGPDHHAVAPQVLMGVQMLGYDTSFVKTLLHQIVNLIRDGQLVKMSTRRGHYVTVDELVDEVGPDAVRYFMLARSATSHVNFDLNLALDQSDENPVFYIQNAHVRCWGIFRKWVEAGLSLEADKEADLTLLTHEKEIAFLRKANELSDVIDNAVQQYEPHHIAFYAYELAATFHPLYDACRVLHTEVPDDVKLARLRLYRAAQCLFGRLLGLMGMTAPEHM